MNELYSGDHYQVCIKKRVQYSTRLSMVLPNQATMYKRPTLKRGLVVPRQFVTEIRANGSRVSEWVPQVLHTIIPNGAPGRVGEIVDALYKGSDCIRRPSKTPWAPPVDYEFIAKYMPECEREAYIAKCKEWFENHPPPIPNTRAPKPVVDQDLVLALFRKYPGAVPPFEERVKVCAAAGYPEEYIDKITVRRQKLEETADERQKVLDGIFGKWPSANKAVPKPKGKVIKAVKKRT
jgi:hypothetical protein